MGLHFHYSSNFETVFSLARQGKIKGITIIDDTDFASALVDLVPYVVLRRYGMERTGYVEYGAARGVIYQFDNEQQMNNDGPYYLNIMQEADKRGRKVVIFNDAVGTTEDDRWRGRVEALKHAKLHGHFAALHMYGDVTKGDANYCPMIDPAHPDAFRWFMGRVFHLYSIVPFSAQPNFIATEAGAGGFQLNATFEQWLADIARMNAYVRNIEWFKCFNLWTMTRDGLGFERDMIDDYVKRL